MSDRRVEKTVDVQLALGQSALDRGDGRAALEWFRAAARGGDARAFNMIGRCHEHGWGVRPDPAAAAGWYRRAVAMGDAWAMFNLADQHKRGLGVAQDDALAAELYAMSARLGNAKALNMLGLFQEEGRLGPPDLRAAADLFHAAARGGDCWGAFNLGRLLAQAGEIAMAARWFEQALATGFPDFWRIMATALEESQLAELVPVAAEARRRAGAATRRDGAQKQKGAALQDGAST